MFATACGSTQTADPPQTSVATSTTVPDAVATISSMPGFATPELETTTLGTTQLTYRALGSDGTRLWAVRIDADDLPEALVRLDPSTGEELAIHALDADRLPDWGLTSQPLVVDYAITGDGVWILESETALRHLDGDDLADRGVTELPPGPKYVGTSNAVDEVWVSHMLLLGRGDTLEGARRIDTSSGEAEEFLDYANCGARHAVSSATSVWVSILCRTQIAATDRATGEERVTGPFPAPATFTLTSQLLWSTYDQIGIVAATDLSTGGITAAYDLDLDGEVPTLDETAGPFVDDTIVIALGRPQTPGAAVTVARLDNERGTLLGRRIVVGVTPSVALLDGIGFVAATDGGLATFDPTSITGGGDPERLSVEPASVTRFDPSSEAEFEVADAFALAFGSGTEEEALAAIENGTSRIETYRTVALAAQAFPNAETVINSMFVDGERADITYSVTLDGVPAFIPLAGYLTRNADSRWQLSEETFCDFASAALLPCD